MKSTLQLAFLILAMLGFAGQSQADRGQLEVEGEASVFAEPDLLRFYLVIDLGNIPGDDLMTVYASELTRVLEILDRHGGARSNQYHTLWEAGRGNIFFGNHNDPFRAEGWLDVEVPSGQENGLLLSEVQEGGLVQVFALGWASTREKELNAEARVLAIKDALKKAEEMAAASGKRVGSLDRIGRLPRLPEPEPRDFLPVLAMHAPEQSGSVPLMPGLLEFKQEIDIVVSLLPLGE